MPAARHETHGVRPGRFVTSQQEGSDCVRFGVDQRQDSLRARTVQVTDLPGSDGGAETSENHPRRQRMAGDSASLGKLVVEKIAFVKAQEVTFDEGKNQISNN